MEFIKEMKVEKDFNVFRRFEKMKINDSIFLSIQASDFAYSEPKETIPLEDYKKMEFAIMKGESERFIAVYDVIEKEELNDKLHEYFEGSVYAYVPVELIEELYIELKGVS